MNTDLPFDFQKGELLLFDKELNWTSFDVVKSVKLSLKRYLNVNKIKVGHAGTLDPLATGLLIVCTGKATKNISTIQEQKKVYTGSFILGASRPSIDKETEIDKTFSTENITEEDIYKTAESFIGKIQQTPPIYSAVKVKGIRAYKLARDDDSQEIEIKSRFVRIHRFVISEIKMPEVFFEIECSKGTYIRSIARDFGEKLNNGAYLNSLRRTYIGDFDVDDAITIEQFKHLLNTI
jgi:tRNA pseudouridine55 synthase